MKGHELCAVLLLYVRGSGTLGILRPPFSLCVWLIMMSSLAHFSPLCTCTIQRGNEKSLPALNKKVEFFSPRTPSSALEHKSVFAMQIRQSTVARAKKNVAKKPALFSPPSFPPMHVRKGVSLLVRKYRRGKGKEVVYRGRGTKYGEGFFCGARSREEGGGGGSGGRGGIQGGQSKLGSRPRSHSSGGGSGGTSFLPSLGACG